MIDNEFDLNITLRILNPENHQVYWWKSAKCCYFQKRFQYQSKIIRVIELKKKRINFLFIAVIYFPLSIQMNILTLYNNCYIILTTYMLDSTLEPSYNLSKNLLLLSWILKLIVDMLNDSTPLYIEKEAMPMNFQIIRI